MELKFRNLRADEIDCRVAAVKLPENGKNGGLSLLLYKDARVDQNILDETVGPMNWQRRHTRDNANCIVSLWDEDKKQWIEKEDTGTESFSEAEKGLASDSFKRACFNWGIGRELYTAPFIWISADKCNIYSRQTTGKTVGACNDKFYVTFIAIRDGRIIQLVINNASKNNQVVFSYGVKPDDVGEKKEEKREEKREEPAPVKIKLTPMWVSELEALIERADVDKQVIIDGFGVKSLDDITESQAISLKKSLQRKITMRKNNGSEG